MNNIENILLFIFVFTILTTLRATFRILGSLLQKEPKPLQFNNRELIFLGLSISYIITFILKK
jgi:hypothetical protein